MKNINSNYSFFYKKEKKTTVLNTELIVIQNIQFMYQYISKYQ